MGTKPTNEELLAKMREHFQERKAVYDALVDNPNRVIANSGLELLQTAEPVNGHTNPA